MQTLAYERRRENESETRADAGADAFGESIGSAAVEQGSCEHKGVERRHAERAEELLGRAEGELEYESGYQENYDKHAAEHCKMQRRGQSAEHRYHFERAAGECRDGREKCDHRREHPESARLLRKHKSFARRVSAVEDEILNEHRVECCGEQIKKPGHVHLSPSFFSSESKSFASSNRRLNTEP